MATSRFMSRLRHGSAVFQEGGQRLLSELRQTRLGRSTPVRLVYRVMQEMGEDDATHMAASVSYYAVLSLFPLLLGLTAIVGWVAGSSGHQEDLVEFVSRLSAGLRTVRAGQPRRNTKVSRDCGCSGGIGSDMVRQCTVFGSITRVVNRAWDVQRNPPFYKNKPRQLAMALGVGTLFVVSIGLTSFLQWATSIEIGSRTISGLLGGQVFAVLLRLPALIIGFAIFLAIYKYLPNTRTYWRYIWPGAALAAVLFELGKSLFLWYLETFAQFDQIYGGLASIIVLMVWTYMCAVILILGAEVASEYGRIKRGVRRGELIQESTDAD